MKSKGKRNPVRGAEIAADLLGDRWSLLILRAVVLGGPGSFKDLLDWGEGIATNVLADRLRKLRALKIVRVERQRSDGRRRVYSVTEKGATLRPVLAEMARWASRYGKPDTDADCVAHRNPNKRGGNR